MTTRLKIKDEPWMARIIIITLIIITLAAGTVDAAVNEKVCKSSWYCTAYSNGECGQRECMDISGCNRNMPQEIVKCQDGTQPSNPEGFFRIDKKVIYLSIGQDEVTQERITVNGSEKKEYILNIVYALAYTQGTQFVTTSINHKEMSEGDFGIVIDSRDINPGTYIFPINISNENYSRNLTLIIDIHAKDAKPINIIAESSVKKSGDDSLKIHLDSKERLDNITYSLLNQESEEIYSKEEIYDSESKIDYVIRTSNASKQGIYILAVKANSEDRLLVKSTIFAVLDGSYMRTDEYIVKESPARIIGWIITGIILGLLCFMLVTGKIGEFFDKYRVSRGWRSKMFNINWPKFGLLGKKKEPEKEDKMALLKKSYDNGFISEREYNAAVANYKRLGQTNSAGPFIGSNIVKSKEQTAPKLSENPVEKTPVAFGIMKKVEEEKKHEAAHTEVKVEEKKIEIIPEKTKVEPEHMKIEAIPEHKQAKIEPKELPDHVSEEIPDMTSQNEIVQKIGFYKVTIKEEPKIQETPKIVEETKHAEEPKIEINAIHKESILDKRDEQRAFGLSNGYRLCSLRDLLNFLPQMPEYMWHHHTKEGRNDFSSWIIGVFDNPQLAEEFRRAETQMDAVRVLEKYG